MYLFWILWTLVLVEWTNALKQGEPGVCVTLARKPKTRQKTVEVVVPCGRGKRCPKTQIKTEKYMEKVPVEICCDSYDYDVETDKCVPVCEDDCEGGKCVAPNICICEPPLVFNNATIPNKCVPPVCDNPCVNGVCTANNQCTCSDGYALKEDNFTCAAQCTNCTNGNCVSPDVCECYKGYTMKNDQCTPECKSDCSHGFCSSPNICTCDHGYEFKDDKCKPVCETFCVNAECVAPNTCKCLKGFKINDEHKEICIPECKNDCSNGLCTAPNVCTCNNGYEFKDDRCKPICEPPCVNGTCVAPNSCKCLDGFETKDDLKESCAPKCESCSHGVCTAPNKCECHEGYALKNKDCEPTCAETCINGYCSGPNQCSCKYGYTQNATNPAICYIPCVCNGGTCSLEGECKCDDDMSLVNGTCVLTTPESSGITAATTTGLASLQMTWWVAGAVGLLLVVLVLAAISRIWHTRKDFPQKATDNGPFGSVAYTLPNTLVRDDVDEADEEPSDNLLDRGTDAV